ncbi:hypothetical protein ACHAPT_007504 [Fusarium lateritium]
MAFEWFTQLLPCFPAQQNRVSADAPGVGTGVASVSERRLDPERQPTSETRFFASRLLTTERDSCTSRRSIGSMPPDGPLPKGQQETLSWLDNGNDAGVIAARDTANREVKESLSTDAPASKDITAQRGASDKNQKDFDTDENGLPIFAVGSPGSDGPFTPTIPSAPAVEETSDRRAGASPRELTSLDITHSARPFTSSVPASPALSSPILGDRLDSSDTGNVSPLGVGYGSFSERVKAMNLVLPPEKQEPEEWKEGNVSSGVPKVDNETRSEAAVRSRAASICSSEYESAVDSLPGLATVLAGAPESIANDSSSGVDVRAESPTTPDDTSDLESKASDSNGGSVVCSETPTSVAGTSDVDKSGDDNNISPDVRPDSPASAAGATGYTLLADTSSMLDVSPESPTTESPPTVVGVPGDEKLTDDNYISPDARPESPARLTEAADFDELADDISSVLDISLESPTDFNSHRGWYPRG